MNPLFVFARETRVSRRQSLFRETKDEQSSAVQGLAWIVAAARVGWKIEDRKIFPWACSQRNKIDSTHRRWCGASAFACASSPKLLNSALNIRQRRGGFLMSLPATSPGWWKSTLHDESELKWRAVILARKRHRVESLRRRLGSVLRQLSRGCWKFHCWWHYHIHFLERLYVTY